jgi:glycosyltransferase involved in cell wall biosynthesis
MEKIKIEVVIPVFNSERFIREGVESVLNQSGDYVEKIWLINDGSEDKTGEILEQLQQTHSLIRAIHQENKGVSAALNRGISEVTGDWIAFMDADDLWLPGKLSAQIELLEKQPELQAIFVNLEEFVDFPSGEKQPYKARESGGEWLSRSTFLCKKSLFDQFGFFDEQLKVGEFIDWFQRVRNSGIKHHYIPQVLAKRRIHGGNLTLKVNKQDYLSLIRKQLAARKKEEKG